MTGVLTPPLAPAATAPREHRPEILAADPAAAGPPPWRLALTGVFVLSLALYVAGRVLGRPSVALGGALGVLWFGVGTAPLQLSRLPSVWTRLAAAATVGLSTAVLIGALIVLTPLWHPMLAAVAVLAAASAVHALALPSALAEFNLWGRRRGSFAGLVGALTRPSSICTLAGTALWLGSAIAAGEIVPGIGGFLPKITPLWYAGVVSVLAGIVLARHEREGHAALGVLSLVIALTLTPALLYGMPRSQSAGKHIELVQLILRTHRLHAGSGIYAAYSAFFAGVAWLCRVAHVSDSLGIATFWPLVMGLVRVAELRFLFGQVIEGRYRRWAAVTLVVLVDAIGADYFSPQAVGYALALGVFGLVIGRRPDIDPRLRGGVILVAGCALAITHELSPYIVGGVLLVLAACRCAQPRWAGLAILAPAGLWALINHNVLKGYFSLSSLGNVSNFAPPQLVARPGLTRDPIVGNTSHALLLGLLVLITGALVGFARNRRERWAWAYVISAGVGLAFVALNPYGNEGIFRASLFGIPWLALLATSAVSEARPIRTMAVWAATVVGLLATFLLAAFGMDGTSVIRPADLGSLRLFNRQAPHGSYLLNVGFADLPSSPPTLESVNHLVAFTKANDAVWQLSGHPDSEDLSSLRASFERIAGRRTGSHTGDLYAIWSPVSAIYASEYGLELSSQADRWRDLLLASPDWQLVYSSGGSYLFRAVGPVAVYGGRRR